MKWMLTIAALSVLGAGLSVLSVSQILIRGAGRGAHEWLRGAHNNGVRFYNDHLFDELEQAAFQLERQPDVSAVLREKRWADLSPTIERTWQWKEPDSFWLLVTDTGRLLSSAPECATDPQMAQALSRSGRHIILCGRVAAFVASSAAVGEPHLLVGHWMNEHYVDALKELTGADVTMLGPSGNLATTLRDLDARRVGPGFTEPEWRQLLQTTRSTFEKRALPIARYQGYLIGTTPTGAGSSEVLSYVYTASAGTDREVPIVSVFSVPAELMDVGARYSLAAQAVISVFIVVIVLAVAWRVAGRFTRPLSALVAAAERVGRGELHAAVVVEGDREVAALGRAFNDMLEKLEQPFLDLAERRRQQAALEESEARFRRLSENAQDLVWRTDGNGTVMYVNRAVERLLGSAPEDVVGFTVDKYLTPDSIALSGRLIREALATDPPAEHYSADVTYVHRDGHHVPCELVATLVLDENGNVRFIEGVTRDVTERKRTQRELRESEQLFHSLVEASHDLIWRVDAEGRFTYLNPAWERTHGYTLAEMLGRPATDFQTPQAMERDRREFARAGFLMAHETTQLRKDGSLIPLLANVLPLRNERGESIGAQGTATDLTEQKKLQTRLLLAERMTSIGTLAAGVAHEINNPLAYIISNIAFALDQLGPIVQRSGAPQGFDPEQLREVLKALDEARIGGDRVRQIVRDLKVFSRPDGARLGAVAVERALESSVKMAHNEIRHRAQLVRHYGEVPMVEANEAQLAQVFLNLLVNAAQAIPSGHVSANEIGVSTRLEDGRVLVEVTDTGTGMSAAVLGRIFDPFFTTKPVGVGTGLGLSTCHGIIAALGGEILVESTVGKGTTFRVLLPRAKSVKVAAEAPVPKSDVRAGRILVVDDDPLVGRALERMLSAVHEVVALTGAREALTRLASGERFDVILCDLMMPEISGMEMHSELTKIASDQAARMVFVTGGAFTAEAVSFLDRVPNRRLDKPVDRQELKKALQAHLGASA